jgi:hypothetical protein
MRDCTTIADQELRTECELLNRQEMQAKAMKQPAQGGGPPPGAAQVAQQFMGGGEAAAASGGETGGAMAGMAAPAALAAAIIANETYQNKSGNRPEDFGDHLGEMATGKVLERDVERYLGDGKVAKHLGQMGNPEGVLKNMKKGLKPWEWF